MIGRQKCHSSVPLLFLLLNRRRGWEYREVTLPFTTSGVGDYELVVVQSFSRFTSIISGFLRVQKHIFTYEQ